MSHLGLKLKKKKAIHYRKMDEAIEQKKFNNEKTQELNVLKKWFSLY